MLIDRQEGDSVVADPLLVVGARVIDPGQGIDAVGDVLIAEGRIVRIGESKGEPPYGHYHVLHAEGMIVSPGFIDLHCHLREPGFEGKETIATGTRAAARGGFTTVCCMPNTDPPIDEPSVVEYVLEKAAAEAMVRVLPIGCVTTGRRGEKLVDMGELAAAGVVALSDDGDPVRDSGLMRRALELSHRFDLVIMDHCEDPSLAEGGVMNEGVVATRLGLKGIPPAAEESMVARDIALAEATGGRLHIAHVSTAGSADIIRRARGRGIPVTAEVTPHHLTLTEDRVADCDTNAKVNPPLRTAKDVEALVEALKEGVIDAIATDHAPHADADKRCEFGRAAFGISGLETALASVLALVHEGKIDLPALISRLTLGPAGILRKDDIGTLRTGACGDVTVFDPNAEWLVDPSAFASKGKNTPLIGERLKGRVMATICRGEISYRDDALKLEMGRRKAFRA